MNEAAVLALINTWIIANGNNEITADVLRPILVAILEQPNDKVGELGDLDTTDQSSIVNAINELVNAASTNFTIHVGSDDPNDTPPGSFGIGDWYIRDGIELYQYNGNEWILLSDDAGETNLSVVQTATNVTINSDTQTGAGAVIPLGDGTDAGVTLNNFTTAEKTKLANITDSDFESFVYTGASSTFTLSRTPVNVDVHVGRTWLIPEDDYTLTGADVQILRPMQENDKITVRLF